MEKLYYPMPERTGTISVDTFKKPTKSFSYIKNPHRQLVSQDFFTFGFLSLINIFQAC
jgi:hypothetical protein